MKYPSSLTSPDASLMYLSEMADGNREGSKIGIRVLDWIGSCVAALTESDREQPSSTEATEVPRYTLAQRILAASGKFRFGTMELVSTAPMPKGFSVSSRDYTVPTIPELASAFPSRARLRIGMAAAFGASQRRGSAPPSISLFPSSLLPQLRLDSRSKSADVHDGSFVRSFSNLFALIERLDFETDRPVLHRNHFRVKGSFHAQRRGC